MKIKWYESLDSTNTYAKNIRHILRLPVCIAAHTQTRGRGRRENVWLSEAEKNLTATLVECDKTFSLNEALMRASLAVIKTLKDFGIEAWIKPPNDVYIGSKKIAGILIETVHEDDVYVFSGIGLNVNQLVFPSLNATSMASCADKLFDKHAVLEVLVEHFDRLKGSAMFNVYKSAIDFNRLYTIQNKKTLTIRDLTDEFLVLVGEEYLNWSTIEFFVKDSLK